MKKLIIILLVLVGYKLSAQSSLKAYGPIWMYYRTSVGVVDSVKIYFEGAAVKFATTKGQIDFTKKITAPYVETDTIRGRFGNIYIGTGDVTLAGEILWLNSAHDASIFHDLGNVYLQDPSINSGNPITFNSFALGTDTLLKIKTQYQARLDTVKLHNQIALRATQKALNDTADSLRNAISGISMPTFSNGPLYWNTSLSRYEFYADESSAPKYALHYGYEPYNGFGGVFLKDTALILTSDDNGGDIVHKSAMLVVGNNDGSALTYFGNNGGSPTIYAYNLGIGTSLVASSTDGTGLDAFTSAGHNNVVIGSSGDSTVFPRIGGFKVYTNTQKKLELDPDGSVILWTKQTGLSPVVNGALEKIGNTLQFTNWAVRRSIVQAESILESDLTVGNTTTETTILTIPHGANYLEVGKMEQGVVQGTLTSISGVGTNTLTVRVKYAGTTYATFVIPELARTTQNIEIHVMTTCRAIGSGTTSMQIHARSEIDNEANDATVNTLATGLNSTTAQATTVTAQWSDADAGNVLTALQSYVLCIDKNK